MLKTKIGIYTFFVTSMLCFQASAQTYFVDFNKGLYTLNDDNTYTLLTTVNAPAVFDIAVSPSGEMYGCADGLIFQIDMVTGVTTTLANLPGGSYNALVCNSNNELYTINNSVAKVYRYDIAGNSYSVVANLGFDSPGDLTFYEGKILFPNYSQPSGTIMAFDINSGAAYTVFCLPDNPDNSFFMGLTNVFDSCGNNNLIGSRAGKLYHYDLDTHLETELPIDLGTLFVYGMTSASEPQAFNCSGVVEERDCDLSVTESELNALTTIYPNPGNDSIIIDSSVSFDSIALFDLTGRKILMQSFTHNISIGNLPKGSYVLILTSGNKTIHKKILKE